VSQVKILCTGDLHLGRTSSKCVHDGEESAIHSAREAWTRMVDCAIDLGADLLLLSGDIADDGSNQYEAMGPFEAGIRRLADRGIDVVMVAGNHDARVLPRLSGMIGGANLRLLGRDGWEQIAWPSEGAPRLLLAGWSFPAGKATALPLAEFAPAPRDGVPLVAIAHTDYRFAGADYAPVRLEDLRAKAGVDLWLLGHLHAPEKLDGPPVVLNPGSPQALDPGEPGVHGPWLVEARDGRIRRVEQLPLSSVAYHDVSIDITGVGEEDELAAFILQHLTPVEEMHHGQAAAPRIACRLRLTGRTGMLGKLCEDAGGILGEQPLRDAHNIYLEQIDLSGVGPDYDLSDLRQRPDIIGALAGMLRDLEDAGVSEERRRLLRGAEEQMGRVSNNAAYREGVPRDGLPAPEVLLKMEGRRLLDTLLRQEESRP
jgi:DNA repair exonuclease SbcCD nuclease subunit